MRNNKGFTLIEALISAAVFVIVIVVALDLFLFFYRQSYDQSQQQQLTENISFSFYHLLLQFRGYSIDYDTYSPSVTNPVTELHVQRSTVTGLEEGTIRLVAGQLVYDNHTTGVILPLTPDPTDTVYIDQLQFYIYPATDPFSTTDSNPPNYQPLAVVWATAHHATEPSLTLDYQNILQFRTYAR